MKETGVVGLVLAAGASTRMGCGRNKLTEPIGGRPMLAWVVDAMLEAELERVAVVVGHEADAVRDCLGARPCRTLYHAGWAEGMGASIAFGVREILPLEPRGVLVCVGDLPGLRAGHIRPLLEAFAAPGSDERIFVASHQGRRGHPVLFGAATLGELARLEGDVGGRKVLEADPERVTSIDVGSDAILRDVDTPSALDAWRGR